MPKCIIFDIDGTLANNEHRSHHLRQKPKDWDAFNAAMHLDTPYEHMRLVARALMEVLPIVYCTGRQNKDRELTLNWLIKHEFPFGPIEMRATGDYRDDTIVKQEQYQRLRILGWEPVMVFDDRQKVVDMWRSLGLPCLQVAPGDF